MNLTIESARLRLEPYELKHIDGLRAMDSDVEIMRYIGDGTIKTHEQTVASIERVQLRWRQRGYSWWAIIEKETAEVIGAACLQHLANLDGAPLELGWRLRKEQQGKGYATEAAKAIIYFAVERFNAAHLVAVAHPENLASHKVMQRLGMTYVGIEEHYDQPCVVYELKIK